jgi:hypothetical protein
MRFSHPFGCQFSQQVGRTIEGLIPTPIVFQFRQNDRRDRILLIPRARFQLGDRSFK